MNETITISKETPALKSMQYQFLKEQGIKRIQELAGEIWTDYNEHDPGITILEVLCYAITDLGYRTSLDIKDILTPKSRNREVFKDNFYTARQIMFNNPVTVQDYRKLLMDVSIEVTVPCDGATSSCGCKKTTTVTSSCKCNNKTAETSTEEGFQTEIIGIKNAWVSVSDEAEHTLRFNNKIGQLDYVTGEDLETNQEDNLCLKLLYDVLLEFDESEALGDLNSNFLDDSGFSLFHPAVAAELGGETYDAVNGEEIDRADQQLLDKISKLSPEDKEIAVTAVKELLGITFNAEIEFPRWDTKGIDWTNQDEIRLAIQSIELNFVGMPNAFGISYCWNSSRGHIELGNIEDERKDRPFPFLADLVNRVNCTILRNSGSLLARYQQRVLLNLELVEQVKSRLYNHRNLGEDFFNFSALIIEEVLVCGDIELEVSADPVQVEAEIFELIENYLAPQVNFYSLDEILNKDFTDRKYSIKQIDLKQNRITIDAKLSKLQENDGMITVSGFIGLETQEYRVKEVSSNFIDDNHTDFVLEGEIQLDVLAQDAFFFLGRVQDHKNRRVEEIFEGPQLNGGFIDNRELEDADRIKEIHASDLINLILDISGVIAIKNLQIANRPQDGNPEVITQSVRWALYLAIDQNYVAKFNQRDSNFTFIKDDLPIKNSLAKVQEVFDCIPRRDRRIANPKLDFEIPMGDYYDLDDYTSIQEEFPLIYGIGKEGVSRENLTPEQLKEKQNLAKQLKGFLLVYDQLLVNYLAQLKNVGELFSFNPELKLANSPDELIEDYNFEIDKTYFSKPLFDDTVPNAKELYAESDITQELERIKHLGQLQDLVESPEDFEVRRNKFLNHLLARFGEQFTDYALLSAQIDSEEGLDSIRTNYELIEDKQDFLVRLPDLSENRGRAFNYKDSCKFWSVDNLSGLENRTIFLTGIDHVSGDELLFSQDHFSVFNGQSGYHVEIFTEEEGNREILLSTPSVFQTTSDAKIFLEALVMAGMCQDNFKIRCNLVSGVKVYSIDLYCGDQVMASLSLAFDTEKQAEIAINNLTPIFESEFFNNPFANRKNFAPPFESFFESEFINTDPDNEAQEAGYTFELFAQPKLTEKERVETPVLTSVTLSGDKDTFKTYATIEELYKVYWDVVFLGRENCQTGTGADEDILIITDRLGDDLARGSIANINSQLGSKYYVAPELTEGETEVTEQSAFEKASATLANFFNTIFFKEEGLHLIEHILLRPKFNLPWVSADETTLAYLPQDKQLAVIPEAGITEENVSASDLAYTFPITKYLNDQKIIQVREKDVSLLASNDVIAIAAIDGEKVLELNNAFLTFAEYRVQTIAESASTTYTFDLALEKELPSELEEGFKMDVLIPSVELTDKEEDVDDYGLLVRDEAFAELLKVGQTVVIYEANKPVEYHPILDLTSQFEDNTFANTKIQFSRDLEENQEVINKLKNRELVIAIETSIETESIVEDKDVYKIQILSTKDDFSFLEKGEGIIAQNETLEEPFYQIINKEINIFSAFEKTEEIVYDILIAEEHLTSVLDPSSNQSSNSEELKLAIEDTETSLTVEVEIPEVTITKSALVINDDLTTDLETESMLLFIADKRRLNFTVTSIIYDNNTNQTSITITDESEGENEDLLDALASVVIESIRYDKTYAVTVEDANEELAVLPAVLVDQEAESNLAEGLEIELHSTPTDETEVPVSYGFYKIIVKEKEGTQIKLTLSSQTIILKDKLLSVDVALESATEEDSCSACRISDPYTYLVHGIMPGWSGRFNNLDFRKFFEKTMIVEAPAHMFLTLCFIDYDQMGKLENALKRWIFENLKGVPINSSSCARDRIPKLVSALSELISVLEELSNVYPIKRLHDCAVEDTIDNAIILNQTALGEI